MGKGQMTICVGRREFIAAFGSVAAWPLAVRAQQPLPVIGFLDSGSPDGTTVNLDGFRRGLGEAGFTDGKNVTIEYRWAQGLFRIASTDILHSVRSMSALPSKADIAEG